MSHLIIIGGTKGLGKAFLASVSREHTKISVLARSVPTVRRSSSGRIRFIAADVTQPVSLHSGLKQAIAHGGKIRHLVMFQQHRGSDNPWTGKLACTLTATRDMLEFCRAHFAAKGDKAVVLLTSIASRLVADEQDEGYHAAKTGLLGLGRYYACQLGPLGVRLNCVSAGTVLKAASKHHFLGNPALHSWMRQVIPLRRMGTEQEVAAAIRFLLSSSASFITGQELIVDGGASLRSQESLARVLFPQRRSRSRPAVVTKT
jgi:NAD(P)-dependent dehydrogenase (short-subunit alcohol dehydrogenase family)